MNLAAIATILLGALERCEPSDTAATHGGVGELRVAAPAIQLVAEDAFAPLNKWGGATCAKILPV